MESVQVIRNKNLILVRMKSGEEKERVMRNKSRLGKEEIYIKDDRTKIEREAQRKVVEIAKRERAKGKKVIIKH